MSWGWETPLHPTWVRTHTASPSLPSGGCVCFHLDPFQAPVERGVIRAEDPLYTLVTDNASQNHSQCKCCSSLPKIQPGESEQALGIATGSDDQATGIVLDNSHFFLKADFFPFPQPGVFYRCFLFFAKLTLVF